MPATTLLLYGHPQANAIDRIVPLEAVGTFARLRADPKRKGRFYVQLNTMMADGSPEYPHDDPQAWSEAVDSDQPDNDALLDALNTALGTTLAFRWVKA